MTNGHNHRVTDCGPRMGMTQGEFVGGTALHPPDSPLYTSLTVSRGFLTFPDKQHLVAVAREALTISSYVIFDI